MRNLRRFIVIRNGDETRLVTTRPHLAANEVAIEVHLKVPQPPRIVGRVDIELPQPPPAIAEAIAIDYPDEDAER